MKILIKNIRQLVNCSETAPNYRRGADMKTLPSLENAWLAIEDGVIVDFGLMEDWQGISDWSGLEIIDADGKMVLPAWCDSHSHAVFAATREGEFLDRLKGLSYQEIAEKGGGILNSASRLQEMSEDELYDQAYARLDLLANLGTGALEIKSGYGLTVEAELKMLRVIKRLKENHPITIKSTFLGAHAFPLEYKTDNAKYINIILNEMIPKIAEEQLADFIDCFCETGYFSPEQMTSILKAGAKHGMRAKVHVNQFTSIGGIEASLRCNALSVDHLEIMTEEDIEIVAASDVAAVGLPSCSFFLGIPYAPMRELVDAGAIGVLATDYNPGSTPSGNLNLVLAMGCIKQKLLPTEAINAVTLNGAYAMELSEELGTITPGKKANLIITRPNHSLAYLPYSFGENMIEQVILNGELL
ncbi:MAG: imidazolonepropionase [Flavobacteriales bacterium]